MRNSTKQWLGVLSIALAALTVGILGTNAAWLASATNWQATSEAPASADTAQVVAMTPEQWQELIGRSAPAHRPEMTVSKVQGASLHGNDAEITMQLSWRLNAAQRDTLDTLAKLGDSTAEDMLQRVYNSAWERRGGSRLVVRVIDGDTVELQGGDRVRLLCVDTPEAGDPGATEATEYLRGAIEGQYVHLVPGAGHDDTDRWGRLLRVVWYAGRLVNADIINAGHSEYWTKYGACLAIEGELASRN